MKQPGIEVRPLRQMTGSAEFNEVFFDGARTAKENALGPVGEGWKVAMATLGFERGTAFMSSQLAFEGEYASMLEIAQKNGAAQQPALRDELAQRYAGLQVMRYNGMRMLTNLVKTGAVGPEASIGKLFWTTWHKSFGETAMRVLGADALTVDRAPGRRLRDRRPALHLHGESRPRRSTPARARFRRTSSVNEFSVYPENRARGADTMNFAFSEEQEELRRTVRQFLEAKSPETEVRRLMETTEGYDTSVWKQMGQELGLQGLAIPEEYGGQGFTFIELGIVLEEMGRVLLCAPYFASAVLAANAILNAGTDAQKSALLPGIASGDTIAALAFTEPSGKWDAAGITLEADRIGRQVHAVGREDVRDRRPHRRPHRRGGAYRRARPEPTASRSSRCAATPRA